MASCNSFCLGAALSSGGRRFGGGHNSLSLFCLGGVSDLLLGVQRVFSALPCSCSAIRALYPCLSRPARRLSADGVFHLFPRGAFFLPCLYGLTSRAPRVASINAFSRAVTSSSESLPSESLSLSGSSMTLSSTKLIPSRSTP